MGDCEITRETKGRRKARNIDVVLDCKNLPAQGQIFGADVQLEGLRQHLFLAPKRDPHFGPIVLGDGGERPPHRVDARGHEDAALIA